MNTTSQWKSGNGLDSIMNVLLIVLALGVLGFGITEFEGSVALATTLILRR